jgi:hypothetical protein
MAATEIRNKEASVQITLDGVRIGGSMLALSFGAAGRDEGDGAHSNPLAAALAAAAGAARADAV